VTRTADQSSSGVGRFLQKQKKVFNDFRADIGTSLKLLTELEPRPGFWTGVLLGALLYALVGAVLAPHPDSLAQISYNALAQRLTAQADGTLQGQDRIASIHSSATSLRAELAHGGELVAIRPPFDDPGLLPILKQARVEVKSPSDAFGWDVVAASTAFATLSAVLAGFGFIAILAILTVRPRHKYHPTQSVLALTQAFLSLVVAALLFSLLAGDVSARDSISPDINAYAISWLLALGIVQMGVAMAWLMQDYGMAPPVHHATWWFVTFAVLLAAGGSASVLVTPAFALHPDEWWWWRNAGLWIWATVPFWVGGTLWRDWAKPDKTEGALDRLTLLAVLAVAGTSIAAALVAFPNESQLHNAVVYGAILYLALLGQCVLALLVAFYQATLPHGPEPDPSRPHNPEPALR
jgi:hypothetical protein